VVVIIQGSSEGLKLGIIQFLVSVVFLTLSYFSTNHGSSAGFELGIFFFIIAIIHPIWWPNR